MRQILLGKAPLGQGGAVGSKPRHLGPPYYLVNDTFTTDRAAGAVNGTRAEPGPGKRTVNDSNSKLSLSGGALAIATGGSAVGNPGLLHGPQDRAVGRVLVAQCSQSSVGLNIGFGSGAFGQLNDGIRFNVGIPALTVTMSGRSALTVGSAAASTTYRIAVVMRATGAFYFIKGGAFTNWTLLFISVFGNYTPLYPGVTTSNATTSVGTCDYIRVPAARWLPTPLVSDGFGSAFGTTDGLGHAEGVAGGLGSGGSGLTWTQAVGSWSVSSGAAAASLTGGRAIATVDCSKADVIVSAKLTGGANSAAILARYTSESDYVELRHTGSNVQLVKVVGTVNTTLINQAVAFVAGAEIRLICDGQKFTAYYNNALVGTEQTIADAGLASGTKVGLRSANASNTFDDFMARARGTGGEYAALDNY